MSSFLHTKYQALEAYTPGEQPRDKQYIKLNTNESPYPPSQAVLTALGEEDIRDLRLYSDPEGKALKLALAPYNRVSIGSEEEMAAFLSVVEEILAEEGV